MRINKLQSNINSFKTSIFVACTLIIFCANLTANAQNSSNVSGNAQMEMQYYRVDSSIGASKVPEQVLAQGFLNLIYTQGKFNVHVRYENYSNPLLGYPPEFKGSGIAYRNITYKNDFYDFTAGNFYESFGSGMLLRAYEEKGLGFDNSLDGVKAKVRPTNGLEVTALFGKQRFFWAQGDGIVRGGNLEADLNQIAPNLLPEGYNVIIGGSVVSRFQQDLQSTYNLPENVLAYSGRLGLTSESVTIDGEFGYKYNDPNATNKYNFNPGKGLILNGSYLASGFTFSANFHYLDNMDFRSSRNVLGNRLNMNYIPALTRQHSYRLMTIYPYASQINGEVGAQFDLNFQIPKDHFLGGKYGSNVAINFSRVNAIDTTHWTVPAGSKLDNGFAYDAPLFGFGKRTYFQDFNIEFSTNLSETYKNTFTLANLVYDKDILENSGAVKFGKIFATAFIYEGLIKLNKTDALRFELQHLWAKSEHEIKEPDNISGNWAMAFFEYTVSPHWFFSIMDEYNYGNKFEDRQLHYLNYSLSYFVDGTRLQFSYGRQRGGLLCVGGICRPVPASNGLYLVLNTTF